MGELSHLNPNHVWKHFENICSIPHPSYHEERVAQYVIDEASRLGLDSRRDEVGNVLVTVPASPGRENDPIVVLQGHLDMVPVAAPGIDHDFEKDPIRPYIDGNYVRARGTTLGADNGIGAAIMLGAMEDQSLDHGPLELLFTINEESGMDGAHGLKSDFIKGRLLINLDTEEWGQVYISCAGGGDSIINLPVKRAQSGGSEVALKISVSGLKGGHSGVDINCGRANANKILGRCLASALNAAAFRIVSIQGGSKRNSISEKAEALISVPAGSETDFQRNCYNMAETLVGEFEQTDPGLKMDITRVDSPSGGPDPMTVGSTQAVIDLIIAVPHGVITMSPEVPGLVETSTNLGLIDSSTDRFTASMLSRSAVTSHLPAVKNQIRTIARLTGAEVDEPRGYPGWKPNMSSKMLQIARNVFKMLHGNDPQVKAIHAGLECGLFSEKLPGVDMISIGPEMHNVHSPSEELEIESVPKTYEYLAAILQAVK
ncbi:aminoacyl-histidine dipeptidase [bacterium]|nr:aminoacyl-histidine dipeptidase [candidate division CSSED10-310 bacterium]